MTNKIPFKEDTSHKWGTYREIQLTKDWMSRIIHFYVGGSTSIHRHSVDEIVIVELGKIKCFLGEDPENLEEKIYLPGEQMYLPAGIWHACQGIEWISNEMPFAVGIEFIWGRIENGDYRIERYNQSIPSPFKKSSK